MTSWNISRVWEKTVYSYLVGGILPIMNNIDHHVGGNTIELDSDSDICSIIFWSHHRPLFLELVTESTHAKSFR